MTLSIWNEFVATAKDTFTNGHARGWQVPAAKVAKLNQSQISKLANGKPVTKDLATRLHDGIEVMKQIQAGVAVEKAILLNKAVAENDFAEMIAELYKTDPLLAEIKETFKVAEELVQGVLNGDPCVTFAGAPGIGKSFDTVLRIKNSGLPHVIMTGTCGAPDLFRLLWKLRKGGILLADDCDKLLRDRESMDVLKGALNSENRVISYRKSNPFLFNGDEAEYDEMVKHVQDQITTISAIAAEDRTDKEKRDLVKAEDKMEKLGDQIPKSFEFLGSVMFISNMDFEVESNNNEYVKALMDRSTFLDFNIRTRDQLMARVRQGIRELGILNKFAKVSPVDRETILAFMIEHKDKFKNISFRLAEKIARNMMNGPNWKTVTQRTEFQRGEKL